MKEFLAANWGQVQPPPGVEKFSGGTLEGSSGLLQTVLRTMIVGAAIYAIFNFILAGYAYISAGGDSKAVQMAGAKITQTIIGLTVAAGAFILAAIVGRILFNDANFLLQIRIFTPN